MLGASAALAVAGISRGASAVATPSTEPAATAADLIAGKDPRLTVHNSGPLEIETPLELLSQQPITPKELLFVRNNQALAGSQTLEPPARDDWTVELAGLVEFPRKASLALLREMPQVEREMVLQCSGNGRAFLSLKSKAKGAPWRHGAMANVKFRGPTLKQVIDALAPNVDAAAKFITAEGRDEPPTAEAADFEHSIPLADALDRSLLALDLNGEPLPAVHGGPVRLVTPGYYGTMHVKWLGRLRFEADETFNHHQVRRYRTPYRPIPPGSEFTYSRENSEPNWRMRIKGVIFSPEDGQRLGAGKITVRGVAFNDGSTPIESVLVSTDEGESWQRAKLEMPESPYAWHPWSREVSLTAGDHKISAMAIDKLGRSQPLDSAIQWNPAGYGFSAVDWIQINVQGAPQEA